MNVTGRIKTNNDIVNQSIDTAISELFRRLEEKGYGSFISYHETLGVVTEEYFELVDAVRSNDVEHIKDELMDLAVAVIFGHASLRAHTDT